MHGNPSKTGEKTGTQGRPRGNPGQTFHRDFLFPALLNRGLVRSLPPLAVRVLRRERCDATAGVFCGRAGDALVECGD